MGHFIQTKAKSVNELKVHIRNISQSNNHRIQNQQREEYKQQFYQDGMEQNEYTTVPICD
jgi:hypothetical protein